jgi:hypothetical protein
MARPVTAIVSYGTAPSISHLIGKRDLDCHLKSLFWVSRKLAAIADLGFKRIGYTSDTLMTYLLVRDDPALRTLTTLPSKSYQKLAPMEIAIPLISQPMVRLR